MKYLAFFLIWSLMGCKTLKPVNEITPYWGKYVWDSRLQINKILNNGHFTLLICQFSFPFGNTYKPSSRIRRGISLTLKPEMKLYDKENLLSFKLLATKGISMSNGRLDIREGETVYFKLIFEKISDKTENVDLIECYSTEVYNCLNLYGIKIAPLLLQN